MEAARIAFPTPRNEHEATTEEQAFIARFQGNRSQRHVYLSKSLAGATLGTLSASIFAQEN